MSFFPAEGAAPPSVISSYGKLLSLGQAKYYSTSYFPARTPRHGWSKQASNTSTIQDRGLFILALGKSPRRQASRKRTLISSFVEMLFLTFPCVFFFRTQDVGFYPGCEQKHALERRDGIFSETHYQSNCEYKSCVIAKYVIIFKPRKT